MHNFKGPSIQFWIFFLIDNHISLLLGFLLSPHILSISNFAPSPSSGSCRPRAAVCCVPAQTWCRGCTGPGWWRCWCTPAPIRAEYCGHVTNGSWPAPRRPACCPTTRAAPPPWTRSPAPSSASPGQRPPPPAGHGPGHVRWVRIGIDIGEHLWQLGVGGQHPVEPGEVLQQVPGVPRRPQLRLQLRHHQHRAPGRVLPTRDDVPVPV